MLDETAMGDLSSLRNVRDKLQADLSKIQADLSRVNIRIRELESVEDDA